MEAMMMLKRAFTALFLVAVLANPVGAQNNPFGLLKKSEVKDGTVIPMIGIKRVNGKEVAGAVGALNKQGVIAPVFVEKGKEENLLVEVSAGKFAPVDDSYTLKVFEANKWADFKPQSASNEADAFKLHLTSASSKDNGFRTEMVCCRWRRCGGWGCGGGYYYGGYYASNSWYYPNYAYPRYYGYGGGYANVDIDIYRGGYGGGYANIDIDIYRRPFYGTPWTYGTGYAYANVGYGSCYGAPIAYGAYYY